MNALDSPKHNTTNSKTHRKHVDVRARQNDTANITWQGLTLIHQINFCFFGASTRLAKFHVSRQKFHSKNYNPKSSLNQCLVFSLFCDNVKSHNQAELFTFSLGPDWSFVIGRHTSDLGLITLARGAEEVLTVRVGARWT